VDLRVLDREAEAKRNLRSELVSRLNDTKAQIKLLDLQGPAARVISNAVEPWKPSYPPKPAMVTVALLLSGVCGAILSVLLERRDGTIRCTDQIRALTPTRVLGGLPVLRGGRILRSGRSADPLKRNSEFSEKLRGIWLQVSHSSPGPARTVLITSPMSGEGKSTIAMSLARMLALSGRKTVILDADLRRPKVHQAFGGTLTPGLAELITRELDPLDVLQRDGKSGACFIPAGAPEMSPADILQMPGLHSALRTLSIEFDAVIIDSPPVLAVHDACLLARRVDRTILVVRWQSTQVTSLNATLQYLSDQDIIVDGILLSMVDGKKYSVYGYQDSAAFSRKFKEYYEA
jgi:capsular exopolysaccharide synthesis family protein